MYTAYSARHEFVSLLEKNQEELRKLQQQSWYCPSCREKLILKNGQIKRPHFAHPHHSECQSFSEGETVEHLAGKALLVKWCQQAQLPYELEAYLPQLKQRPDILIKPNLALEFQCSPLSRARFYERTRNYQQHGYQVIWLLGKKFSLTGRLGDFQRRALSYSPALGFYLWELDVTQEHLACHLHVEENGLTNEWYYYTKRWNCLQNKLLEVLAFPKTSQLFIKRHYALESMLFESLTKLEQQLIRREPTLMKLQEEFYLQGSHLRELSGLYFLPPAPPFCTKATAISWRYLLWQLLVATPKQSLKQLFQDFYQQVKQVKLPIYELPLVTFQTSLTCFFTDYLELLVLLEFVAINKEELRVLQEPLKIKQSASHLRFMEKELKNKCYISATPRKTML